MAEPGTQQGDAAPIKQRQPRPLQERGNRRQIAHAVDIVVRFLPIFLLLIVGGQALQNDLLFFGAHLHQPFLQKVLKDMVVAQPGTIFAQRQDKEIAAQHFVDQAVPALRGRPPCFAQDHRAEIGVKFFQQRGAQKKIADHLRLLIKHLLG